MSDTGALALGALDAMLGPPPAAAAETTPSLAATTNGADALGALDAMLADDTDSDMEEAMTETAARGRRTSHRASRRPHLHPCTPRQLPPPLSRGRVLLFFFPPRLGRKQPTVE